jgi:tetratricopeptide (TPR) repeat protein
MLWLRRFLGLSQARTAGMRASINGDNAIIVQVSGNDATITIDASGAARLTLERRHLLRRPAANLHELPLADLRCTTLVGRHAELDQLQTWLAGSSRIAFRCHAAPPGHGKTRLAIELCDRATHEKWHAGFVRHAELRRFVAAGGAHLWRWQKPTLAVIDDAAAVGPDLREWLAELSARPAEPGPPLRILLLDRTAWPRFGWWADLTRSGDLSSPGPLSLFDPPEPFGLPPLEDPAHRRALFAESLAAAIALHNIPSPASDSSPLPESSFERHHDPFGAPSLDAPLSLIMAGMIASDIGVDAALALGRNALARRLADAERARLEALATAWGVPGPLVTHLAACATLQQGCDPEAALRLVREETAAIGWPLPLAPEALAVRLADALADPARRATDPSLRRLDPARPHLVGLALIIAELGRDARPPADQAAIVERACLRDPDRTAESVLDAIQAFAGDEPADPTLGWFHHLVATPPGLEAVLKLIDNIDFGSVALSEPALALQQDRTARLAGDPASDAAAVARAYDQLGCRLAALGRSGEAADAGTEAVCRYAALRPPEPVGHAVALLNRTPSLDALGRRTEALADTRYAALLLRRPARTDSVVARLLARAMDMAGVRFAKGGDHRRSLRCHHAAILRLTDIGLIGDRGVETMEALAGALINYSHTLAADGQIRHAVGVAEQGADFYRRLARSNPDVYAPPLALALTHLALCLSNTGGPGAVEIGKESVDIYRRLAAHSPGTYRTNLARALNNLSVVHDRSGDRIAALAAAAEADHLFREHGTVDNPQDAADHTRVLGNLADILTEVGKAAEAVDPASRALVIHRRLARADPGIALLPLMNSLSDLADALAAAGRLARACTIAHRAVVIGQAIERRQPGAAPLLLATAESRLARNLAAAGRETEAMKAAETALQRLKDRVAGDGVPMPDAAMIVANLGLSLAACGRTEGAIAHLREAEHFYRTAIDFQPWLVTRLATVTASRARLEGQLAVARR